MDSSDDDEGADEATLSARLAACAFTYVNVTVGVLLSTLGKYPFKVMLLNVLCSRRLAELGVGASPVLSPFVLGYSGLFTGFVPFFAGELIFKISRCTPTLIGRMFGGASPDSGLAGVGKVAVALWKVLAAIPRTVCEIAWIRMLLCQSKGYESTLQAFKTASNDVTRDLVAGFGRQWWAWFVLREAVCSRISIENRYCLGHFVPRCHVLYEKRDLLQCFGATPLLGLWLLPLCGYPLTECTWSSIHADIRDACWTVWWYWIPSFAYGFVLKLPLARLYSIAKRRAKDALFEDENHRLARKLQHAAQHAMDIHGKIDLLSFFKAPSSTKESNPLRRQMTTEIRAAALVDLSDKRDALTRRISEHALKCSVIMPFDEKITLRVRRANISSALMAIAQMQQVALLKAAVKVVYIGELGVDQGGVFRDFMDSVAEYVRSSKLFELGSDGSLLPAKQHSSSGRWREELFAIGRVLALAITSNTPLDICFSCCLYKVLLGEKIIATDVARIDPDFAKHRIAAVLEDGGVARVETVLCDELMFVGVDASGDGAQPLIPNGQNIRVTERNKRRYIRLLIEHYLVGKCRAELALIIEGFRDIIPRKVLRGPEKNLRAIDLELIVTGLPTIDVEEWRAHTTINSKNQSSAAREHVQLCDWLFEVLSLMSTEGRAKVLAFACGSSRLPSSGFAGLKPYFDLVVHASADTSSLPTAHTCFNQLCMPLYSSREELQERLRIALDVGAVGFGLC
eukprot:TRINITY_DN45894_c0_g1_i1.p1 TRINITY_DN45894_c0_g1~~TRINITY_DN45894_c0_g1_i1.p1  ORF type:complete len:810 (-),score=66.17 TRINITY_DN45894_c0_g1_i1:8-2230(-)